MAAAFVFGLLIYGAMCLGLFRHPDRSGAVLVIGGTIGAVVLLVCAARYPFLAHDRGGFESDPSCRAGFSAPPEGLGRRCGAEDGEVSSMRYESGRGSCRCYRTTVVMASGTQRRLSLSSGIVTSARLAAGFPVRLQTRDRRIVAVATQGGSADVDSPDQRLAQDAGWIAFGAGMLAGVALQVLLFVRLSSRQ